MSSRIMPLAALSVMLLVIFWAVVATAQQPGAAPVGGQFLPIQRGDVPQAGQPPAQYDPLQGGYNQPAAGQQFQAQPAGGQVLGGQVVGGQPAGAQPLGGLPSGGQPPVEQPMPQPMAPFQLTPQEQQQVDRILDDWQAVSSRVKTLEATFTLFDYNAVFNPTQPGQPETPIRTTTGNVRYAAPDKGYYATEDGIDKWVCTGAAIFEFNSKLKKVREYRLPPQMQGQAISDGPMPFVFGVEKQKMLARYWLKVMPTPPGTTGQVWLEAYPKLAKDAANFKQIHVILKFVLNSDGTIANLEPYALNLIRSNGKERSAYIFQSMTTNSLKARFDEWIGWFVRPNAPAGWMHELADDGVSPEQPAPGAPPGVQPAGPPPGAGGIGAAPQPVVPR